MMDDLIKAGLLPLDAANELLRAQKNKLSNGDYSSLLQVMQRDGKFLLMAQHCFHICTATRKDIILHRYRYIAQNGTWR